MTYYEKLCVAFNLESCFHQRCPPLCFQLCPPRAHQRIRGQSTWAHSVVWCFLWWLWCCCVLCTERALSAAKRGLIGNPVQTWKLPLSTTTADRLLSHPLIWSKHVTQVMIISAYRRGLCSSLVCPAVTICPHLSLLFLVCRRTRACARKTDNGRSTWW